uniref:Peptide deformylase n=1 Tax=Calcidiscus leptoporus TaxID=127549 RepID=A0A7S0IKH9_9EUKA
MMVSSPLAPVFRSAADLRRPCMIEINPGVLPGSDLRILEYPHPKLRAPNDNITKFDDSLRRLSKEMFAIMYASRGVGLAAPQLGINKRLMVFNPDGDPKKWMSEVTLVNPEIVEYSGGADVDEEGCLSFPGFTADVQRSVSIQVRYQNTRGKVQKKKLSGWVARIFQHEFDHLSGTLYVDRLDRSERMKVQTHLDRLILQHGPGGAL